MSDWEYLERERVRQEQETARDDRIEAILFAILFGILGYLLAFLVLALPVGWFVEWDKDATVVGAGLLAIVGAVGGAVFGYRLNQI